MLRAVLVSVFIVSLVCAVPHAQAPAQQTAAKGVTTTWYFYKVKWGFQDEFVSLFAKNHLPLLKAQEKAGRFLSVKTYVPRYHGDGRADWTFAVELVARDDATGGPSEEELVKQLYPDQPTYTKEEQRRFEILEAHWDVPLNQVALGAQK
jgi:hypothetical protein